MRFQRILKQFIVDASAACDPNKLSLLQTNQVRIRTNLYNGLTDVLQLGGVTLGEVRMDNSLTIKLCF